MPKSCSNKRELDMPLRSGNKLKRSKRLKKWTKPPTESKWSNQQVGERTFSGFKEQRPLWQRHWTLEFLQDPKWLRLKICKPKLEKILKLSNNRHQHRKSHKVSITRFTNLILRFHPPSTTPWLMMSLATHLLVEESKVRMVNGN